MCPPDFMQAHPAPLLDANVGPAWKAIFRGHALSQVTWVIRVYHWMIHTGYPWSMDDPQWGASGSIKHNISQESGRYLTLFQQVLVDPRSIHEQSATTLTHCWNFWGHYHATWGEVGER